MTKEQAALLQLRFEESQTEWRRLTGEEELREFLAEAMAAQDAEGQNSVQAGTDDLAKDGGRSFTLAAALIVETGTLVLTGRRRGARRAAFLAEEHYALVTEDAVFDTLADFLNAHADNWRAEVGAHVTLITGPSRTADIEKILVLGAHGPRRLVIGSASGQLIAARFAHSDEKEASP